jgi:hypothetical protein
MPPKINRFAPLNDDVMAHMVNTCFTTMEEKWMLARTCRRFQALVHRREAHLRLDIIDRDVFRPADVQAVVDYTGKTLIHLDMSGCESLHDYTLQALAKGCPRLTHLYLCECKIITEVGLAALATYCTQLTNLDVRGCSAITNASLKVLAKGCTRLVHLLLSGCPGIADAGLEALAKGCTRLTCESACCIGLSALRIGLLHWTVRIANRLAALDRPHCESALSDRTGLGRAALPAERKLNQHLLTALICVVWNLCVAICRLHMADQAAACIVWRT